MFRGIIILLYTISYCNADIQFPKEMASSPADVEILNRQLPAAPQMSKYQSKNVYEKFIDDIITKGITDLGFTVHRSARNLNQNADKYLVYSPVSIASALYMLLLGSNGQTFTELSKILGVSQGLNIVNNSIKIHEEFGGMLETLESSTYDGTLIKFANGLFVQTDFPLRQQYVATSSLVYQSETKNLDFKNYPGYAKDVINNWTNEKTFGKIDKILNDNPSTDTKVVIVSSLYFKADWSIPFDSSLTSLQPFYSNGKSQPSKAKFHLMATGGRYLYYNDSFLGCDVVGLPYKGNQFTFYVLIPHNSNKDRLKQLETQLTYLEIKRLTASVAPKDIIFAIPKMKLTSNLQLSDILEDNGLKSLFDPRESNLALLSGDNFQINSSEIVGFDEGQPYVFSRMKQLGDSEDLSKAKRKKREQILIGRNKRQQKVLSPNRFDNLDTLRHFLSKEAYNNPGLYVNQILHKVVIDINEKGTEAAAVTAVSLEKTGRLVVKADVPFIFFIQHEESKMLLFWGSVVTPSPSYPT